jgi:hypothetical protein
LAIEDEDGNLIAATKKGWNNQLQDNGKEIVEFNENEEVGLKHYDKIRIVFAKYKNPLGDSAYKFIGIFKSDKIDKDDKRHYVKFSDSCKIIRR